MSGFDRPSQFLEGGTGGWIVFFVAGEATNKHLPGLFPRQRNPNDILHGLHTRYFYRHSA